MINMLEIGTAALITAEFVYVNSLHIIKGSDI